jgi:glucose-1-phosphate cytidylyltransferase
VARQIWLAHSLTSNVEELLRVAILAGGVGTRLSEETGVRPKPMVDIGGRPILWHIMKCYSTFGLRDFVVALGYKGDQIKEFFMGYNYRAAGSLHIETRTGTIWDKSEDHDDWDIDLVETGLTTNTGGRVLRLRDWLTDDHFCLSYGDGVADVDVKGLIEYHHSHGKLATITAVRPPSRFGGLVLDGGLVTEFVEKPQIGEGWINGGFMVLDRRVFERIAGDETSFEADVLEKLASDSQLMAYRHEGFWQCMDTLRDTQLLRSFWETGEAPWRTWV